MSDEVVFYREDGPPIITTRVAHTVMWVSMRRAPRILWPVFFLRIIVKDWRVPQWEVDVISATSFSIVGPVKGWRHIRGLVIKAWHAMKHMP